jgi:hypothetical protein
MVSCCVMVVLLADRTLFGKQDKLETCLDLEPYDQQKIISDRYR